MLRTFTSPRTVVSRLAALAAAGLFAFTAASAFAQDDAQAVIANRITQPINPDVRVTLQHNVHPLAQPKFDQGAAPGSMATGRIMLVLKRNDTQENALKQYLGDLQNPNSPNYRKWLTPAVIGKQYGISDTDLTTVTAWLQSQGFTVDKIPQARNVVEFSGNVAQIQQAFNTSIHKYVVNGETHFANSTDPQIPAALAPVVAGIASLNDFHPKSYAVKGPRGHFDPETKTIKPDLTLFNSNNTQAFLYVDPADAATIYDTPNTNLNTSYSGTTYDGTGVTIGIAGDSNISLQDITNYRTAFLNDTSTAHLPNVIVDGNDPGVNGDAVEALLDNEVAGGIAPGAKINFYTAADTDFQSGLFLAIYRALDDNAVSILNVSFGGCEAGQGVGGNLQASGAWEQAAAQGISVTVSTGDEGSAGCDDANSETQAQYGLAVNGLASTPYNIAVGGTDFDVLSTGTPFTTYLDPTAAAPYVNLSTSGSAPYYGTALKYIPEKPWNDSTASNNALSSNSPAQIPASTGTTTTIASGGGGISSQGYCPPAYIGQDANGNYTCSVAPGPYPQPPFQAGVTNSISTSARALPDVSLLASDGAYGATWVVCADSVAAPAPDGSTYTDCQTTGGQITQTTTFSGVGGTSAASPAFAGMLALVGQSQITTKNPQGRLGQANNVLYNLYTQSPSAFHDVTSGNNSVYCTGGTQANCTAANNTFLSGYNAGTGYDAASGLGSVDVAKLVSTWSSATFTPTTTSFKINNSTAAVNVTHGTSLNFSVAVSPSSAGGDVSVLNDSGLANNGTIGYLTLSGGTAAQPSADLPGGSYNVYAYYGGDVKDAASTSTKIAVNITAESSATAIGVSFYDPITLNYLSSATTSVPYGLGTSISAEPQSSNANSTSTTPATGNITFTDSASLSSSGNVNSATEAIASNGIASYNNWYTEGQSPAVASHSVTAKFAGDVSYGASTSSALAFTVTKGPTSTDNVSGAQSSTNVTLQAQIDTDSIGLPPTGAVTFTAGGTTVASTSTATATGFVANGSGDTIATLYEVTIPVSTTGLVNGNNTITATYSGDTNYSGSNGSATVTITTGGGVSGSFKLSGTNISIAAGATTGNTSTITVTPASGFTGAVTLSCAITSAPTGAADAPTCSIPSSVTISGTTAATTTLTVSTTAPTNGALTYPLEKIFTAAGGTALACLLMFAVPARRRSWRAILGILVFVVTLSTIIGCGSSGGNNNNGPVGGTTAGTYVVTVTGKSGSTSATTTVSVSVQ